MEKFNIKIPQFKKGGCSLCNKTIFDILVERPNSVESVYKSKPQCNEYLDNLNTHNINIIKILKRVLQ